MSMACLLTSLRLDWIDLEYEFRLLVIDVNWYELINVSCNEKRRERKKRCERKDDLYVCSTYAINESNMQTDNRWLWSNGLLEDVCQLTIILAGPLPVHIESQAVSLNSRTVRRRGKQLRTVCSRNFFLWILFLEWEWAAMAMGLACSCNCNCAGMSMISRSLTYRTWCCVLDLVFAQTSRYGPFSDDVVDETNQFSDINRPP